MKTPKGFQKPVNPGVTKQVGLPIVTMGRAADMEVGTCSCGTVLYHKRKKVLEDRIDKHFAKKHNGRGFRL